MNVGFLTNHEKTEFFHAIATRLEARGHVVSWIAPSHVWATWLREHGAAAEAVLDLSTFGPEWTQRAATAAELERLRALEDRSGLRIKDVILMDRLLRERPYETMLAYFAVCAREIERFVTERSLALVLGEQTFGVEVLTGMLCEVLVPFTVRIPAGRVGLFRGYDQRELLAFAPVTDTHSAEARAFVETFRRERPRPDYFARSDKQPLPHASWPGKLWKHLRLEAVDPYDETHFPPGWLVRKRSSEVANALLHRVADPFWVPPQPPPRPYVLFPLHRQPEASIDVLGARFSNQLELVRALARTVPATHDIYVKEHPNGRGDRSPDELRALAAVPGVRLVAPGVSTFALADTAALTITISGTASYEAALLRRPAATVANMFYGAICVANAFNPYVDSVADLLARMQLVDDARIFDLVAHVLASSFPGLVDNPLFTPAVMDPANLDSIAAGIARLLAARASSPPTRAGRA